MALYRHCATVLIIKYLSMKIKIFKFLIVGLVVLFSIDAIGLPVVHYSRVKKKCGLVGCGNTAYDRELVTLNDGSQGWAIDINCYGSGTSLCPRIAAPDEDPEEYDNYPEVEFIYGYIEDQVDIGNTTGSTTLNVADQYGVVWIYSIEWDVTPGAAGESDTETYSIIRIGSL